MDDLEADFGYDADAFGEQRDLIEYDLEKLLDDTIGYIEDGDVSGLKFLKTNSDWIDRYAYPDEYAASLESRVRKLESLVRKMHRNSK